jgi:hypothetical protein
MALTQNPEYSVQKVHLNLDQWKCLRATGQVTVRTPEGPLIITLGA